MAYCSQTHSMKGSKLEYKKSVKRVLASQPIHSLGLKFSVQTPTLQPVHLWTLTDRPALIMFLHEGHDQYPLVFFLVCWTIHQACWLYNHFWSLTLCSFLPFQNNVPKTITSEECMYYVRWWWWCPCMQLKGVQWRPHGLITTLVSFLLFHLHPNSLTYDMGNFYM